MKIILFILFEMLVRILLIHKENMYAVQKNKIIKSCVIEL